MRPPERADTPDKAVISSADRASSDIVILVALVLVSLFLTSTANHFAGVLLRNLAPNASWIAGAAIPSFLVIAAIYLALGNRRALRWPTLDRPQWRQVAVLGLKWLGIWLAGSVAAAFLAGHWITYARGGPQLAAFLLFGPLGEELLFRGLILDRAQAVWPADPGMVVLLSTVTFSLHHIQLHPDPFHGIALAQLIFTIPMGIVFARLRLITGTIWVSLLLHVATNLPASF